MEKTYTIDKAAYLLGVEVARLEDLIAQNLVETEEVDGSPQIPKREIARLYKWVTDDPADPVPAPDDAPDASDALPEAEDDNAGAANDAISVHADFEHGQQVTDPELLRIYGEMRHTRTRIENLSAKMKRLGTRIARLQTIGAGDNARFWERASALYPQLWSEETTTVEERDGALYICRRDENERDDYKLRLQKIVAEGIQKGHLPPGFMGLGSSRADDDHEDVN